MASASLGANRAALQRHHRLARARALAGKAGDQAVEEAGRELGRGIAAHHDAAGGQAQRALKARCSAPGAASGSASSQSAARRAPARAGGAAGADADDLEALAPSDCLASERSAPAQRPAASSSISTLTSRSGGAWCSSGDSMEATQHRHDAGLEQNIHRLPRRSPHEAVLSVHLPESRAHEVDRRRCRHFRSCWPPASAFAGAARGLRPLGDRAGGAPRPSSTSAARAWCSAATAGSGPQQLQRDERELHAGRREDRHRHHRHHAHGLPRAAARAGRLHPQRARTGPPRRACATTACSRSAMPKGAAAARDLGRRLKTAAQEPAPPTPSLHVALAAWMAAAVGAGLSSPRPAARQRAQSIVKPPAALR